MSLPPAFLFIGPEQECVLKAFELVISTLCARQSCYTCSDCLGILRKQHYLQLWLRPDHFYTLSQIETVFKITSFALQPDEHYFIVFERADLFNLATANSLLKLLEEPPRGYHFILLAQRTDSILPTVISRCVVETLSYKEEEHKHPLYRFFTTYSLDDATEFVKELDRKGLERDVPLLLDQLSAFWHERMLVSLTSGDDSERARASALGALLQEARLSAPLAGSAKIFFKNLYLQFLLIVASGCNS